MHFVTCPRQGRELEAVVLHKVGFLAYPCPKQGHDFKPSAAPLYPNMGQVPPPPSPGTYLKQITKTMKHCKMDSTVLLDIAIIRQTVKSPLYEIPRSNAFMGKEYFLRLVDVAVVKIVIQLTGKKYHEIF